MKSSFLLFITVFLCSFGGIVYSQTVVLEESFGSVDGSGGNDGGWSGSIAGSPLNTFGTWSLIKAFKGNECLKLGTTTLKGELTTPVLSGLSGDAILTFSAGAWNAANEKTTMELEIVGGGSLSQSSVPLVKGSFTNHSIVITGGTSSSQVVFKGAAINNARFFIDSIKIVSTPIIATPEILTSQINGVYGDDINEAITVSNSPISFILSGTLPNGVSFSMGTFSGIPTETGVFSISLIATNSFGNSISKSIDIVIDKANQFLPNTDDVILDINQLNYTLSEKTSANLDVFYTVVDTTIASISNNVLQVEGIGVTEIIATQSGNQNYNELLESILLVVLEDTPDCGVEDFMDIGLPSSYHDGAFIGNNNVVWNYVECRNENADANGSGIDGSAIMLRRVADESRIYSTMIPTGVGSFSAKLYKGFTGTGNRQVELFVNGESKGLSMPFDDYNEHLFIVDSINISGDVIIELRNTKSVQVIVDDISWTCYSDGIGETVWDGIAWSNGNPTSQLKAVVQSDFQTFEDVDAYSLEIEAGAVFILDSDNELTVGDIINKGVFKVSKDAYILQNEGVSNEGVVQVEIETDSLKRLDYMILGSPVVGQNLYGFSPETLHNRFYEYDTPSNSFMNGTLDSISSFQRGKAYGIRTPNTFTNIPQVYSGVYTGSLNNDTLSVSVSTLGYGFNLLSNPYASLFDLDAFFEENTHLDASAYVYINANGFNEVSGEYTGNNYAVYNKTGVVSADNSSIIPTSILNTARGFVVKATANNDVLFTNSMRLSKNIDSSFVVNTPTSIDRYWLELKRLDASFSSQMLIGYVEGATNGIDRLYDAIPLPQNTMSITSVLQGESYAIQGRISPFLDDDIVNLRVVIKQPGEYSIGVENAEGIFIEEQDVYLKDNQLGMLTKISREPYVFSSTDGLIDDRFQIVYQNSLLANEDFLIKEGGVHLFLKDRSLKIDAEYDELLRVELVDMRGALVFDSGVIQQVGYEVDCSKYARGIYVVRIELKNQSIVTRKIIL